MGWTGAEIAAWRDVWVAAYEAAERRAQEESWERREWVKCEVLVQWPADVKTVDQMVHFLRLGEDLAQHWWGGTIEVSKEHPGAIAVWVEGQLVLEPAGGGQ